MKRSIAIEVISLLFVFLFVYTSANKLLDVYKFRVQLGQSPLLTQIAWFATWFVPLIELVVSVLLVISRLRLMGLLGAFGLMTLFTVYIIYILQFSEYIPCACGGVLQSLGWTEHLIFNITFILLAVIGIVLQSNEHKEYQTNKLLRIKANEK